MGVSSDVGGFRKHDLPKEDQKNKEVRPTLDFSGEKRKNKMRLRLLTASTRGNEWKKLLRTKIRKGETAIQKVIKNLCQ